MDAMKTCVVMLEAIDCRTILCLNYEWQHSHTNYMFISCDRRLYIVLVALEPEGVAGIIRRITIIVTGI